MSKKLQNNKMVLPVTLYNRLRSMGYSVEYRDFLSIKDYPNTKGKWILIFTITNNNYTCYMQVKEDPFANPDRFKKC